MQKKSEDFSVQEVMRLAESPAGQQLLALLQQQHAQTLQQAASQASQGDYTNASQTLQQLLTSEEVKRLMQQFRR